MATVTGYTSARMNAMEAATVIAGTVTGDNLILTTRGGTQINAGNVRGATGIQGIQGPGPNPTGTFIMGGWTTDPSGYLILDGRVIANGATAQPALWALFTGWRNSTNLMLPNADNAVPMQATTPGVVSGAMTKTLVTANVPGHTHSIVSHTHTTPNHAHNFNHDHSASSGYVSSDHSHTIPNHQHSDSGGNGSGLGYGYRDPGGPNVGVDVYNPGSTFVTWVQYPATTFSGGGGATGGISANHYHGITVDIRYQNTDTSGSGTTGGSGALATDAGSGTGTAFDVTPKNLSVRYAVKT